MSGDVVIKNLATEFGVSEVEANVAQWYLNRYGYLKDTSEQGVRDAILDFQYKFSLEPTMALDRQTLRAMTEIRCGVPDNLARTGAKWNKDKLRYFVADYLTTLSKADQDDQIDAGYDEWSLVCNLEFSRADREQDADIVITCAKGRAQGFDGPLGTLAYAYLPNGSDGQLLLVFDMDDNFVRELSRGQRGILYRAVFNHETGHNLGLDHSSEPTALMYPTYNRDIVTPQRVDDVPRIQSLYGPPSFTPNPDSTSRYTLEVIGTLKINGREVPSNWNLVV